MRHGAQVFEAVALLGDRIGLGVLDPADHRDSVSLDFQRLALALGFHQLTGHLYRAAGGDVQHLVFVVG